MDSMVRFESFDEIACGTNFAYILKNNSDFQQTEYKVLQSQKDSAFIKCMKMLYNGKVELYYMIGEYRSFSSIITKLDTDSFITIVGNLFNAIIEVKNNGFLSCQKIDISFDKIFINMSNLKVKLTYLPIISGFYQDYVSFENELRANLIKLIKEMNSISSTRTMTLCCDLSDVTLSIENLYSGIKRIKKNEPKSYIEANEMKPAKTRFVLINSSYRIEINISKNEFILGKNPAAVDGVITFNKAISRVHCKIIRRGERLFIMDMGSANGTYVNKIRVMKNEEKQIKAGDIIMLANSEFEVVEVS